MKINRNILNAPIVILGMVASLSSVSTTTLNYACLNDKKSYIYKDDFRNTNTNTNFNEGILVEKIALEEDTNIENKSTLDNKYLTFKQENEQYIIKNNMKDFQNEINSIFGGMRYLTNEEQEEYNNNLNNIYRETGTELFDFV